MATRNERETIRRVSLLQEGELRLAVYELHRGEGPPRRFFVLMQMREGKDNVLLAEWAQGPRHIREKLEAFQTRFAQTREGPAPEERPQEPPVPSRLRFHIVGTWNDGAVPVEGTQVRFPENRSHTAPCPVTPAHGRTPPDAATPQRFVVARRHPTMPGLAVIEGWAYGTGEALGMARRLDSREVEQQRGFRPVAVEKPKPVPMTMPKREYAVVGVVRSGRAGALLEVRKVFRNRGLAEVYALFRRNVAIFPRSFPAGRLKEAQWLKIKHSGGFENDPNARKLRNLIGQHHAEKRPTLRRESPGPARAAGDESRGEPERLRPAESRGRKGRDVPAATPEPPAVRHTPKQEPTLGP